MDESNLVTLWRNGRICPSGDIREVIDPGAIVVRGERIAWIGGDGEIPTEFVQGFSQRDLRRCWVTPGLVDCHTHLVYAGNRADEWAQRLSGATYEEVARAGGGINSTVRATRAASEDELFRQSAARLTALLAEGVTLVEIKSGYGLELAAERKMLKVARRLGEQYPVSVRTTFLGAHAVPPEYADRAGDYMSYVSNEMLPTLHREGLVDAVDVFCENIGFTLAQSEQLFAKALAMHLPVKMHAEQLSNSRGAQLAARYHALSADHLEHLDESGVMAMKQAGVVAVLLPGAFYFLRDTRLPPIDLLRRHGVPMALATDSNPGTSPTTSLLLMMNMGCTLFRLTPAEALLAVTRNAARALGRSENDGILVGGRHADFSAFEIDSLSELAYWSGFNPCRLVVRHGEVAHGGID